MDALVHIQPGHAAVVDECGDVGRCRSVCSGCKVRLFAVCSALDDHEIQSLEQLAQQFQVPAKKPVIFAGDAATAVYTLTSGFLRLQRDLSDGRRQVIGFAAPGDFIGLGLNERYAFAADALTDVTLCRFDRARFTLLTKEKMGLLERLHARTSHELSLAQDHMVLLGRRKAEERVALFLAGWRKRLQISPVRSPTIPLPMGRQDIADHLGLTIETVSRIIARWTRERILLDVPGGVRVLNEAALSNILDAQ